MADERLQDDPFYIRTANPPTDPRTFVLTEGDTFAVFNRFGDIRPIGLAEEGLYHGGTRYLSQLTLRFAGDLPMLLSSAPSADNSRFGVDMTNVDVAVPNGDIAIARGTLHLSRVLVLRDGLLQERVTLRNHGRTPVTVALAIAFDADFRDIFEVRGTRRDRRGASLPPRVDRDTVELGYVGLDRVTRRTRITFQPPPASLSPSGARFEYRLAPQEEQQHVATYGCEQDDGRRPIPDFRASLESATARLAARRAAWCEVITSDQQVNAWMRRSQADLAMMTAETSHGEYPYAGVPWFSTPFGRDGIIAALECLWTNPGMARGVLAFLTATQATALDPDRDAQPGKILHEMRGGEMAALGEIPFGQYYGSHDATPLFIMLAETYHRRTADLEFIRTIWPAIEAAASWMDRYGDLDGDGFLEYARQSPTGLLHQGWKDSGDAIFHADGSLAEPPIALCEVQAYAYAAWRGAAHLASSLGHPELASAWNHRAGTLRRAFEAAFWSPSLGTYALALDAAKQPCLVRSSNAGHALFTGIASRDRAARIARTLLGPEGFSGWGIRTIGSAESFYNPMSYHRGSVWPHDNAIIAAGLARYGFRDEALSIFSGLFDASTCMDLHRIPELFCGFPRRPGDAPTLYPVACSPQAWAAGSAFMVLQAVLGLDVVAARRVVRFTRAKLPGFIDDMVLKNLQIGAVTVDLRLDRHEHDVGINVLRRGPGVDIASIK